MITSTRSSGNARAARLRADALADGARKNCRPPSRVFADGHQIQQVLLNLLINAEQAMLGANAAAS